MRNENKLLIYIVCISVTNERDPAAAIFLFSLEPVACLDLYPTNRRQLCTARNADQRGPFIPWLRDSIDSNNRPLIPYLGGAAVGES
jgi:hypothetical protein